MPSCRRSVAKAATHDLWDSSSHEYDAKALGAVMVVRASVDGWALNSLSRAKHAQVNPRWPDASCDLGGLRDPLDRECPAQHVLPQVWQLLFGRMVAIQSALAGRCGNAALERTTVQV